jgi:2-phospho-L-lactate guanylyltransferase
VTLPVHAVVPVRHLADAKSRLAPVLAPWERVALAAAMARDVLEALLASPALASVRVVTADPAAEALARALGAGVIVSGKDRGFSAAADLAARTVGAEAPATLLLLPADVPLVRPATIAALVARHGARPPAVTLVQAAADGGTNAVLATPPDAVAFRFGAGSFERHGAAARERRVALRVAGAAELAFDLDRPADLARFVRVPSATRTFALLDGWSITARLPDLQIAALKGPLP